MRWTQKPKPTPEKVEALQKALQIDKISATLLVQRNIETYNDAKAFFRPSLSNLHDPFLMKDMDKAVARIEQALSNQESIMVYGDYDVDGTTSVALMASYLTSRQGHVTTYIPDRYTEGYGISFKGIDFAYQNNIRLIVALDCGIKAVDKIDYAQKKGIDFIICDHHIPANQIPNAVAVLDPKQHNCAYPYKDLCGCGVGFKLIEALAKRNNATIHDLLPYLDLVATAIGADIVPITGENRILAYFGLQVINTSPRVGMQVLLEQTKKQDFSITDLVFTIAPRINAAGRMKHGNYAVSLLTETNYDLATKYAQEINAFNLDRREADKRITQEALQQIENNNEQQGYTTVVYHPDWHKGVLGIVASRLTETYYRPTLVFTKSGDKLAASARSVKGFDVYNALDACREHIEQFGGHKYAAGLTLHETQYEAFKTKFETVVAQTIEKTMLTPEIAIDTEINLNDISPKFYRILKQIAPFGPGNMTPIFMTQQLKDTGYGKCVGAHNDHIRTTVTQNGEQKIASIGFNLGHKLHLIKNKKTFKAAYSIDENNWKGTRSLQLKLRDIND